MRRLMWRLRDGLRRYAHRSQDNELAPDEFEQVERDRWMPRGFGACGVLQAGESVSLRATGDGRVVWKGLATCGLTWECPVCQMNIKAARADQVGQLVEWHGKDGAFVLSLTVRHGLGSDLRKVRKGLANAWRGVARGRPWDKFKQSIGMVGTVRALEVTHGSHGWHPHLHVLVLAAPGWEAATMPDGEPVSDWLLDRWRSMVSRYVGAEHEPDDEHAIGWTPCTDGKYLAKLGLEVSDPGAKAARNGNRTPLEIARDLVDDRKRSDRALWRIYCRAMHGARQLTWTQGLRQRAGIPDKTDAELAQDEEQGAQTASVLKVSGDDWRWICRHRVEVVQADNTRHSVPASVLIIERAEQKGARGAWRLLRSLVTAAKAANPRGVSHGKTGRPETEELPRDLEEKPNALQQRSARPASGGSVGGSC